MFKKTALLICICLFAPLKNGMAAAFTFDPAAIATLQEQVPIDLIKTLGFGADYNAYAPSKHLGLAFGLSVGVDVTVIAIPDSFRQALVTLGSADSTIEYIPLPRLNIQKGLPFGFNVGFGWIGYEGDTIWSLMANWTLPGFKKDTFELAARASYTNASIDFISTSTVSLDGVISKSFAVLTPYVGAGIQYTSGSVNFNGASLPVGVSADHNFVSMRMLGGLELDLYILAISAQATYSLSGVLTMGGKVSIEI